MRMEGHARTWFTPKQKAELWERWKSGQCVADIARALERRNKSGVYRVLAGNGGIAPAPRRRALVALRASIRRLDSARHVLELREVERLRPFETALGEHLKHRFDALGVIQAAERDEDHSREALQVAGEHPGTAFGAEVSV